MNSGAEGAENFFDHSKWSNFFSLNIWQTMIFLHPLDALIPKIPFSFFANFWVRVTSEARGSLSVGFLEVPSIEPLFGERGVYPEGSIDPPPPPPKLKARPALYHCALLCIFVHHVSVLDLSNPVRCSSTNLFSKMHLHNLPLTKMFCQTRKYLHRAKLSSKFSLACYMDSK